MTENKLLEYGVRPDDPAPTLVITEIDGTVHHIEADPGTLAYRLPRGTFRPDFRWLPNPPKTNPTLIGFSENPGK